MAYCPYCGASVQATDRFCGSCGKPCPEAVDATAARPDSGTLISIQRIVAMSILSYGLYFLYWFYLTWKHYRDHTRTKAYPVWHALSLFVPIYSLFRVHAHVRSFKELALGSGLQTSLSPGLAVAAAIIINALDWTSFRLGFSGEGRGMALATGFLDILSVVVVIFLLVRVQGDLNDYWRSSGDVKLASVRTGKGEIALAAIGVVLWLVTILSIAGLA